MDFLDDDMILFLFLGFVSFVLFLFCICLFHFSSVSLRNCWSNFFVIDQTGFSWRWRDFFLFLHLCVSFCFCFALFVCSVFLSWAQETVDLNFLSFFSSQIDPARNTSASMHFFQFSWHLGSNSCFLNGWHKFCFLLYFQLFLTSPSSFNFSMTKLDFLDDDVISFLFCFLIQFSLFQQDSFLFCLCSPLQGVCCWA